MNIRLKRTNVARTSNNFFKMRVQKNANAVTLGIASNPRRARCGDRGRLIVAEGGCTQKRGSR